jgi:hypothetical protein
MEVIATSIYDWLDTKPGNWRLKGESYAWMVIIYGLMAVIFPTMFELLAEDSVRWFNRAIIYSAIIMFCEYTFGWLLERFIGNCPWKYTHGLHLHGLMKLSYWPYWMIWTLLAEQVYFLFS